MTTQEIANKLVELCRMGKNEEAYNALFSDDAVAVEPAKWNVPDTQGKEALLAKSKQWMENIQEFHGSTVSEPLVAGDFFTLTMSVDITQKDGQRINMEEVCVYEVKDGKIVKEQFFH
ncbi:MAG: nuclear transport factor 2 family protein [Bacteroidota bacterium]